MEINALTAALQRELDGYMRRGMHTRAEAVRTELIRLGCSPGVTPDEVVPSEPDSTPTTPAKRSRKPATAIEEPPAPKTPAKRKKAEK
jgi:pentatricopeptide repeat protein